MINKEVLRTIAKGRVPTIIFGVLAAFAFARLLQFGLSAWAPRGDFNYYWLAGRLWREGIDPYGPRYVIEARLRFGDNAPPLLWAYTPNWFPLASVVSFLPVRYAGMIWNGVSGLAVLGGIALLHRTMVSLGNRADLNVTILLLVYACLMTAATTCMMWGNCSLLMFAAACLLAWGVASSSKPGIAAALTVMLLKPNIGIPLLLVIATWPGGFLPAVWSAVFSAVMALPALVVTAPFDIMRGLAATSRLYETFEVNSASHQPGIANLLWLAGAPVPPAIALLVPISIIAIALARFAVRTIDPLDHARRTTALMYASLTPLAFVNRLHIYDLVVLIPLIAFVRIGNRLALTMSAIGGVFIFRPENMATALGWIVAHPPSAATLASIGCLAFFGAALAECLGKRRKGTSAYRAAVLP